ncbi:MAG: hypothetical protein JW776_08855 [Candidatus Lokiarchaeota archaeon]|nr:hypothetical protein [Candidatus Lokiarchaeota archaeon]
MFRKQEEYYSTEMEQELNQKLAIFYEKIRGKKILIGLTGGLKSYMLVELARPVVTEMKCMFVETSYTSPSDLEYVRNFKKNDDNAEIETDVIQKLDLNQNILILNSDERDFFCKKGIADILEKERSSNGYDVILDGTAGEQFQSFWNGKQKFGDNYLMIFGELGIFREDVVYLSKKHGFKFNRPPEINLLSRFAYNIPITEDLLKLVVVMEGFLKNLTNNDLVRVRILDKDHIIIETGQKELSRLLDEKTRKKIYNEFSDKGFSSINIDLAGYRRNNLFKASKNTL